MQPSSDSAAQARAKAETLHSECSALTPLAPQLLSLPAFTQCRQPRSLLLTPACRPSNPLAHG